MALIISLETSSNVCSVALYNYTELISCSEILVQKSHSSLLTVMIQQCVEQAGYKLSDLNAVAVSAGPGSYTGLRIGASVAKGLCYSLEIPLIAVDTLYSMGAMVAEFVEPDSIICPMLDARRMEVYCALLDSRLNVLSPSLPKVLSVDSFEIELENTQIFFFGNGSDKFYHLLGNKRNAKFLPNIYPSAKGIGKLALKKFEISDFENVIYFEPNYLKEFVSASKLNS